MTRKPLRTALAVAASTAVALAPVLAPSRSPCFAADKDRTPGHRQAGIARPPPAISTAAKSGGRSGTAPKRTTEPSASPAIPRPLTPWPARCCAATWRDRARPPRSRSCWPASKSACAMWNEMQPFYSDAEYGAGKEIESRNAESVLNAVILASYDAQRGI